MKGGAKIQHCVFTVTNDLSYDQRMMRICSTLSEAGYEVHLIGRQLKGSIPLQQRSYRQTRLKCFFNQGPAFYFEYNLRLFFYLVMKKGDIHCACDLDSAPAAMTLQLFKNRVWVFDAHEHFTEVPELIGRKWKKRAWEALAKYAIPRFDLAYTVSASLAERLSARYKAKFYLIRNLPLPGKLPPVHFEDRPHIILYQGALNAGRGLERAILMMHFVTGYRLVLAGEGDLSEDLRDLVKNEGLEEKVEFLGRVEPEELRKLTITARLGLNLLDHAGESYYYSLSNKFFDYIQCGVPSINPDFPEYGRVLAKFPVGIATNIQEPQALAGLILNLLDDRHRLEKMTAACAVAAKDLNWHKESEKLLTIYRETIEKSQTG